MLMTLVVATIGSVMAGLSSPARSDEFYKDKTVTMTIGGSVGGGYDTLARGIARYLNKHIPGTPAIVAKNMPGGGGVIAMNYLYNTAAKDGAEIGLVANNTPFEPMLGNKNARYDATKFNWLGTPSFEIGMVVLWHTVPVNSVDDLRKRVTTVGASGSNSSPAFFARVLNETLGTKMRAIHGYEGLSAVFVAMERGEVEGTPSVFYSALTSTRPNWLPEKQAKAIVQYGPEKLTELGSVPFAPDLVKDPEDKLLLQAAIAPLALGRPLVMPPDVPSDRVAAMRKALADTFTDPEFKAHADKIGLIVDNPRTGQQLQDEIARTYSVPPKVVERLQKLMHDR
jgi:tripartite-type tricarboxylate transporter receptor subunit TctC